LFTVTATWPRLHFGLLFAAAGDTAVRATQHSVAVAIAMDARLLSLDCDIAPSGARALLL
jgi:hypothetical protein